MSLRIYLPSSAAARLAGLGVSPRRREQVYGRSMWLAGIPVDDRAVLQLAASLREAELVGTAETLNPWLCV